MKAILVTGSRYYRGDFRKKPVVINAVQITEEWFDGDHPNPLHPAGIGIDPMERTVHVGCGMVGRVGDWLVEGAHGESYLCKADIFASTFELLGEQSGDQEGVREGKPEPTSQDYAKAKAALGELGEIAGAVASVAQLLAEERQANLGHVLRACGELLSPEDV